MSAWRSSFASLETELMASLTERFVQQAALEDAQGEEGRLNTLLVQGRSKTPRCQAHIEVQGGAATVGDGELELLPTGPLARCGARSIL